MSTSLAASSIRLTRPRFTLVGATTRTGLITGPLRDRFGLVARLDYYDAGASSLLIRGFDPLQDAIEYGRELIPLVRAEVARRVERSRA